MVQGAMFGSRVVLLRKRLNTGQLRGEMLNYRWFVKDSRRFGEQLVEASQ
jgi:hypothetical protein